jgi:glutamyl-tRNA synthetase
VADDVAQGITHVIRGADLLFSTARQIQLWQTLGATPPTFAHVGLVVNAEGEKLSKRDGAITLAALREAGHSPEKVIGMLAPTLGYSPAPRTAAELADGFVLLPQAARPWVWR